VILEIKPGLIDDFYTREALRGVMCNLNLNWDYAFVSSHTKLLTIAMTNEAAAIFELAGGNRLVHTHFREVINKCIR
jgi:hypothetical protein